MSDHLAPTVSTAYATYTSNLMGRVDDAAAQFSSALATQPTNHPLNTIRWNAAGFRWEINAGTVVGTPVWNPLVATTASYQINVNGTIGLNGATPAAGSFTSVTASSTVSGAGFVALMATPGPIGSGTASTGAFSTLTTSGIAGLAASSTVGGNIIATQVGTETLTNKTLTTPIMSTIWSGSSATPLTLPVATDTLVGRATTDTLTNKSLTTPKITTALWDTAGAVFLAITPVASSVNYLTLTNAIASGVVTVAGTGTNCGINFTTTGTGTVQIGGVPIVTTTTAQTVTTKTITGGSLDSCPIGTTTASTGKFTTLDISSSITGSGLSTYLASPPAIGGNTPAAGTFTALVANTSLSGTGINNLLASPTGPIGTTTPVIGRFTAAYTVPIVTTFSATAMVVDCSLSNVFTIAMTAPVTTAMTFSNLKDGQTINIFITQSTASSTMVWPNNTVFKWPGGTPGVLSTAVGSVDLLVATYRAATGFWYVSLTKNFS